VLFQSTTEEVRVEATQTPSPEHVEFDRLCAAVEDFEPLPARSSAPFGRWGEEERWGDEERWGSEDEETPLDELILACLVSPV
jgi:hypothetical protein